ncbi:FAD-binding domain containing protein [Amanita muscaria]
MSNDIPGLSIRGSVITPSSPGYDQAISRPSATCVLHPAYVVCPQIPSDIPQILHFARSHDPPLEVAVKGGATNLFPGLSSCDGGIIIDLARLNHVEVAEDKQTVAVGGGALWGDVYSEIEKHGIVVVGAGIWSVGVGGMLVGGGYSNLSGQYGLSIDNILEATVVLADGRIVTCNAAQEPDLFWAIRGAGNQFGIVTEFVLRAYPSKDMFVGALAYPGTELTGVLQAVRVSTIAQTPDARFLLCFSRMAPEFHPSMAILPYIEGPQEKAEKALEPFRTIAQPVFQRTTIVPSFNAVSHASDAALSNLPPRLVSGTVLYSEFWDDVIIKVFQEWVAYTEVDERRSSIVLWEFDRREKIAAVETNATAYPARDAHYYAVITARHSSPETDAAAHEWISKIVSYVKKTNLERTGMIHPTPSFIALGNEDINEVYGKSYARLRKLKATYDPHKIWNRGFTIEPDFN